MSVTGAILGMCPCGAATLALTVFASAGVCLTCTTVFSAVCVDGEAVLEPHDLDTYLVCLVGGDSGWSGEA